MIVTRAGVELSPDRVEGDPQSSQFEYDREEVPPSMAVVAALSEVLESDPTDLAPLAETIDVDALDQCLQGRSDTGVPIDVSIPVAEYVVHVRSDGTVKVTPSDSLRTNGHGEVEGR